MHGQQEWWTGLIGEAAGGGGSAALGKRGRQGGDGPDVPGQGGITSRWHGTSSSKAGDEARSCSSISGMRRAVVWGASGLLSRGLLRREKGTSNPEKSSHAP